WSRVFAIDQTNAEAGALIDHAKAGIDEHARRADEIYYRAVDAGEAGREDEAIGLFEGVLAIAPNPPEARAAIDEERRRAGGGGIDLDAHVANEITQEKRRGLGSAEADSEALSTMLKQPPSVPLALDEMERPAIAPPTPLKQIAAKPA